MPKNIDGTRDVGITKIRGVGIDPRDREQLLSRGVSVQEIDTWSLKRIESELADIAHAKSRSED
jgi:hypothetical protein